MQNYHKLLSLIPVFICLFSACKREIDISPKIKPTQDIGKKFVIEQAELPEDVHHIQHFEIFGKYVDGINAYILKGIDIVQSHAMDGGGYFIGINAEPPESPVYYNLKLFDRSLLEVPRQSSYCSGATYSAFIEALNLMLLGAKNRLSAERFEALRLQEPDGSRREDHIKFWGHWNADGYGNYYALVQYSKMGIVKKSSEALPGDFVNISWTSGKGHSVIFLGWTEIDSDPKMVYWSSQPGTNGYGDQIVSLSQIKEIKVVRLVNLDNLFKFNPDEPVELKVAGDLIE